MMTDWVTIKEAIDYLGMSERTIRRHVAEGKITSRLENGRRLLYVGNHVKNANGHDDSANEHANGNQFSQHADDMPTMPLDLLLQEKDARIQQLEEQVERLSQLLAMAQKTADRLAEQNQLLLEDKRPKRRWYHRLFAWNNVRELLI